jgi:class 3 adenylate cyclase
MPAPGVSEMIQVVKATHPAGESSTAKPARQLTAVLFVDIVDATPLAVSLGDRAWAELLEQYHELVSGALERHRGWLMDTAGDGFFAIFDEAADAIRCALDVRRSARWLGLRLRSGVHLGHCWTANEKCAGADVHLGARLASSAGPDEVLVSEEAAERAHRAGIAVTDRGHRSLKGLPGNRRVFVIGDGSNDPTSKRQASMAAQGLTSSIPDKRRRASAPRRPAASGPHTRRSWGSVRRSRLA